MPGGQHEGWRAGNDRGHRKTTAVEGDSKTKNCRDWVLVATHSEYEGKVENGPLSLELQGPGTVRPPLQGQRPHW